MDIEGFWAKDDIKEKGIGKSLSSLGALNKKFSFPGGAGQGVDDDV